MPCLNKKLFGVECPGCGLQRSVDLLLHGEFLAAFKMYPAIYPLLLLLVSLVLNVLIKSSYTRKAITLTGIISASAIIMNYIFKLLV